MCQTFGCKIFVDKEKIPEYYQSLGLIAPEILSQDSSSRFQLFDGFPKLYERAESKIVEARANYQHEPLIIRTSAQWYVYEEALLESENENKMKGRCDQAVRDMFGVWHVCYSMHSSREELEWALQLLSPKWVVSTTPSCRAMELDFGEKRCFKTPKTRRSDDSLWRLLDISIETLASETPENSLSCSPILETIASHDVESQPQTMVASRSCRGLFNLTPPRQRPSITLFGRARHGTQDSISKHDKAVFEGGNSSRTEVEHISLEKQLEDESKCGLSEKREVKVETKSYRTKDLIKKLLNSEAKSQSKKKPKQRRKQNAR